MAGASDAKHGAGVMAAVEEGDQPQLVVADLDREGAHVTLPLADAASLPAWR